MHPRCPVVSVVIPCYNAERWIARCIESVLDQHNVITEIIVIDDGSTDRSLDIIKSFEGKVTWKTGLNRGGCSARNRGLDLASGEFIIFLDADDYIERDSIGEWAAIGSDADLVFGPFANESGGSRTLGKVLGAPVSTYSIVRRWLHGCFIPPCSILWRRSFISAIGGWNEEVLRNQDGEVTIRGLLKGARVRLAHRGLGVYVDHQYAGRVSKRTSREILSSQLSTFENLWALAQERGYSTMQKDFAPSFYLTAYEAFATGVDEIGRIALSRARQMGLKGHLGTFGHRTLASILGLRNKLRLTGIIKGRRLIESSNRNASESSK